ncbi:hypothetical protein MUN82_19350 [Hymenobacter aerilatus]|uniref:STAS/SEC14 domain-containing protein n=1 Tax=Hymenobacter aerilatus TaxID=2932251 RepID=A0A8T9SY06_9BACT|nr:STAS/SEC14 domain-containing protein [Hymenobacter aerilatus]UOR05080.1 hypothetical protein MUN82_19350 [Hymenobacter aerilatus]
MMAPLSLYYENVAGRLLADPAGFLRVVWSSQPRSPEDVPALFAHMTQALQHYGWSRILINQVAMRRFSPQEQEWVANEWLPHAVQKGGYRYGAVLVSPDVMTRLATAFITTKIQGLPLVYHSFDEETTAVDWLLRQA